jgi:hypothetical protein
MNVQVFNKQENKQVNNQDWWNLLEYSWKNCQGSSRVEDLRKYKEN